LGISIIEGGEDENGQMASSKYSVEFKKAVVEKLLNRGTRPVTKILEEVGISSPTLYLWKADFANISSMKNKQERPQDRSPEEKLNALIAFENLPLDRRGEFLRKQGLHEEHLRAWRKQIEAALQPVNKQAERFERAADRRKIIELEKDLKRKDKALAETAALLILKKKRI
jgi:transposase-like protein